ncbi:hypothetical protein CEUSTIGMA_g11958.t1 [Chlamydomonas eustigma]|uniref:Major capsid protein N-terminal domain-containing protein n=1 Tax=Chlamydomonas eustigma TaxID=1157962 RepID=A0A250XN90_9CHLO|nr:hypothetical protein CEUSTIGMA_g11958.t1 [Chlamydomonas eustigma]|eukprot:GAX84537.1 hypothetical protein CEUSTIGMA_g11958.t1 [Chlamydomonas eustigma]
MGASASTTFLRCGADLVTGAAAGMPNYSPDGRWTEAEARRAVRRIAHLFFLASAAHARFDRGEKGIVTEFGSSAADTCRPYLESRRVPTSLMWQMRVALTEKLEVLAQSREETVEDVVCAAAASAFPKFLEDAELASSILEDGGDEVSARVRRRRRLLAALWRRAASAVARPRANPQITFFKVVYRRHTNFAMESIEQVFNGQADWGRKVTATISRNGDLIFRAYLRVELPAVTIQPGRTFRWLNWVGHILMKTVEIEIGGQRIDKHYGDWLHIWNELTQTAGHQIGYANMVGNTPNLTTPVTNSNTTGNTPLVLPGQILYIPLEFWWNRNPGLALPLIALQYHEVRINMEINPANYCYWSGIMGSSAATTITDLSPASVTVPSLVACSLFVDYIYLDTDERRRFAQAAHEYLIEQLQFTGDESTNQVSNKIKMSFNHPTKELIWIVQPNDNTTDGSSSSPGSGAPFGKQWFNYTDAYDNTYDPASYFNNAGGDAALDILSTTVKETLQIPAGNSTFYGGYINNNDGGFSTGMGGMPGVAAGGANGVFIPTNFAYGQNPVAQALLQLNGHDRFSIRDGRYFSLVQPYQHHENVPTQGINVYSFALKPEEHQPSGSCNFSRIDTATLNLTLTQNTVQYSNGNQRSAIVRIYAVNYNIMRIMSGMGGLAYSN